MIISIAACDGMAKDGSGALIRDSVGITIVENLGDPAVIPVFAEVDPIPLAEIGVMTGNPEQEFGRISDADLLSEDRILVADGQARSSGLCKPPFPSPVSVNGFPPDLG